MSWHDDPLIRLDWRDFLCAGLSMRPLLGLRAAIMILRSNVFTAKTI